MCACVRDCVRVRALARAGCAMVAVFVMVSSQHSAVGDCFPLFIVSWLLLFFSSRPRKGDKGDDVRLRNRRRINTED